MFFLTGTAASSALDLIATLRQTLGAGNSGNAQSSAGAFDTGSATTGNTASTPTDGSAPQSLLAPDTLDALLAVQGQGQAPVVNGDAFSQQLFSLLDSNKDGTVSKSEFEGAFAQNGDTTKADSIFGQLDANGDGTVTPAELTNAIEGGSGSHEAPQVHHHHHHHGGAASLPASSPDGDTGATTDPLAALGGSSQTVTNADGSSSTTITFSDGSQVSMTLPATQASGTGGMLSNYLERMIERQAQMLAGSAAGQSLAVTA